MRISLVITTFLALLLIGSCGGSSGSDGDASGGGSGSGGSGSVGAQTGTLIIEATDAFLPHSKIAAARIWVNRIQVHGDAGGGFLTLYDGTPLELDLLTLRNGLKKRIANANLPVGAYDQCRLRLSDAFLELTNGNQYSTQMGTMKLTSTSKAGLKVFVEPPITLTADAKKTLLLDFDLSKTFKPIPGKDPMTAKSYMLHPVIKASDLSKTGELRGRVVTDDGQGGLVGVASATVSILHPGEPDPTNAITTTGTKNNGDWAVLGLEPGFYDVHAMKGSLSGRIDSVNVQAGIATSVQVEIE